MKKYFLVPLILWINIFSAGAQSCCSTSITEQFGQLAMNAQFAAAHEAPLPFLYVSTSGSMVSFPCKDGSRASAFEVKSVVPSSNWLIVIHEWWGLNDYIKQVAEKLQTDIGKINILAVDLYDGKIAETPGVAQELMAGLKDERARMILRGAIEYTGTKSKVYTLGWCMGGGWSMQTALLAGSQSGGCIIYYGMPETDPVKLKTLKGDVLGIFGTKDTWINADVVGKFATAMKSAGKKLILKNYDADHAFANPSNPKHDVAATSLAYAVTLDFIKSRLK